MMVVAMRTCTKEVKGEDGKKLSRMVLRAQPDQSIDAAVGPASESGKPYHVGGGISAPVPLNNIEAKYSPEARQARIQGVCLITLVVDAKGMPQNPRVIKGLGHGLDEKAVEAVKKYRFKPATKLDGAPVPVQIAVEVNFRLY
jgi:TonB family protein